MGFFSFLKKEKQQDFAMSLPDSSFSDIPQVKGNDLDLPLPPGEKSMNNDVQQGAGNTRASASQMDTEAAAFADAFSKVGSAGPAGSMNSAPSFGTKSFIQSSVSPAASISNMRAPPVPAIGAVNAPTSAPSPFDIPEEAADIPDTIPDLAGLPDAPAFGMARASYEDSELLHVPPVAVMHSPHGYPNDFAYEVPGFDRREIVQHNRKGPLFVRVEVYQQVLDFLKEIEVTFKEEENNAERLNDLKNAEDKEFERFRELVEDIERKLLYVDKTLFEE